MIFPEHIRDYANILRVTIGSACDGKCHEEAVAHRRWSRAADRRPGNGRGSGGAGLRAAGGRLQLERLLYRREYRRCQRATECERSNPSFRVCVHRIGGVHLGCNVEGTYGVARAGCSTLKAIGARPSFPPRRRRRTFSRTGRRSDLAASRLWKTPNRSRAFLGARAWQSCRTCCSTPRGRRVEPYGLYRGASPYGTELAIAQTTTTWDGDNLSILEGRVGLSYKFGIQAHVRNKVMRVFM